jgi:hypothetical protein
MIRGWFSFRALLAAVFALGLAMPPPSPYADASLMPAWLTNAICHAGSSTLPDDQQPPAHSGHVHCALCLTGMALLDPPEPATLAGPALTAIAPSPAVATAWFWPATDRPYASRAPPGIG